MTFARFAGDRISLGSGRNDRVSAEDAERQERTAREILKRLHRQPGVVLADEVGMGKTFVALAVAASVALARPPSSGPVIVMVPPSLRDKWPRDWKVFGDLCLDASARARLRAERAERGGPLLRLLDDPPSRRAHIIFLTHGALYRAVRDPWIRLALIRRAFLGRPSLRRQRAAFARFAGPLLRMKSGVGRRAPELFRLLLNRPFDRWAGPIRRYLPDASIAEDDDVVPAHLQRVLDDLEHGDVAELVEALRRLPLRESANVEQRLHDARRALSGSMRELWRKALGRIDFRSPLLILDEAHHLRNPRTRLASLFIDDEAEQESELLDGALAGKFDRMLFLTATPFQLGHQELVNVLRRFGGIRWSGRRAPELSREEFVAEIDSLTDALNRARQSALIFERMWSKVTPEQADRLVTPEQADRLVTPGGGDGRKVEDTTDGEPADPLAVQLRETTSAMRRAEESLRPWVWRSMKPARLPGSEEPRRRELPGAAIRDDRTLDEGLQIGDEVLLPFLLAGRAQALLAASKRGRAYFAEGLSSSFEAFVETRDIAGDAIDDDGDVTPGLENAAELEWYLQHLERALPRARDAVWQAHPKIRATAERVVELWWAGEKVLVFCHYRATGRALRRHVSDLLDQRIAARAREQMGAKSEREATRQLAAVGNQFFGRDSRIRRDVTARLEEIVRPFRSSRDGDNGLGDREAGELVEVFLRFVRTPSFLVRYVDLSSRQRISRAVQEAIEGTSAGLFSLRRHLEEFGRFLAKRCVPDERDAYLQALRTIQTGAHHGREGRRSFDPTEQPGRNLLPNVRLANGEVADDTRRRLLLAFNTPLFPEILIASSVLAEGVDLHLQCRYVIHHDLCWNPSTLEQRTGRVDRVGALAERVQKSIHLYLPYLSATQDEKMFRVVRERGRWFQIVMDEKYEIDELSTDRYADRVPLPDGIRQQLSMRLAP